MNNAKCVLANDVLDELIDENRRILSQLLFADKCLTALIQLKTLTDFVFNKYKYHIEESVLEKYRELSAVAESALENRPNTSETKTTIVEDSVADEPNETQDTNPRQSDGSQQSDTDIDIDSEQTINKLLYELNDTDILSIDIGVRLNADDEEQGKCLPLLAGNCNILLPNNHLSCAFEKPDDTIAYNGCNMIKVEHFENFEHVQGDKIEEKEDKVEEKVDKMEEDDKVEEKGGKMEEDDKIQGDNKFEEGDKLEKVDKIEKGDKFEQAKKKRKILYREKSETTLLSEELFFCDINDCTKSYRTERGLNGHKIRYHRKNLSLKCSRPNCKYRTRSERPDSVRRQHSYLGQGDFRCALDGCDNIFTTQNELNEHMKACPKSLDTINTLYSCPHKGCGKTFASRSRFERHSKYVHSADPVYTCDQSECRFWAFKPWLLRAHKLTHCSQDERLCGRSDCRLANAGQTDLT